jgi:transcriptional regulator with XRE-family HTH domain
MIEQELLKKIGQNIKEIRTKKGVSQLMLAGELNYDKSNISRLESGRINPKISTLYKVAKALDITLEDLVKIE